MPFSANVGRLQPSATIAVATLAKKLTAEGRDIIDLSAGEPDFPTPSWVGQAAIDAIRKGNTKYTPVPGTPELRKAIAATLKRQTGREIDWNAIVASAGAKHSIFNACFTLFGAGDEVLVGAPYWTSYPEIVRLARAEPVMVFGAEERDYLLTPADLEKAVTERTRGLILNSPSNPTGAVYSLEELRAVAEWARDRGVWLISDEIYRFVHYGSDAPAPGIMDLPPESLGPFVLVDGTSKSFAMTGWRVGFTYSELGLAKKMGDLQSHMTSNPTTTSQVAACAAFTQWDRVLVDVRGMVAAFRRRRDLVVGLFDEFLPQLPYVKPTGAFYLYFRVDSLFREGRADSTAVCNWLLEEAEVAMVPGVAFGDDRYVRLSYATSDQLLAKAIHRVAKLLKRG